MVVTIVYFSVWFIFSWMFLTAIASQVSSACQAPFLRISSEPSSNSERGNGQGFAWLVRTCWAGLKIGFPQFNITNYGKSPSLIGKSTINGQFSIAMLVYQRVRNYHVDDHHFVPSKYRIRSDWTLPFEGRAFAFCTINAPWCAP